MRTTWPDTGDDPIRIGNTWLFDDGTRLPVVAGGDGPDDEDDDDDDEDGPAAVDVEKWKKQSRRHENRAKANKKELDAVKAELAELKKGQPDEDEVKKLTTKIGELTDDLAKERLERTRAEVAAEKGLTQAQAKRLQGSSREEMEDDADDLLEAFGGNSDTTDTDDDPDKGDDDGATAKEKQPTSAAPPRKRPTEKLQSGGDKQQDPEPDVDEVVKKIGRL